MFNKIDKTINKIIGQEDNNYTEKFNSTLLDLKIELESEIKGNIDKEEFHKDLIEIYKAYFTYIQSIQARRWKQHTFYFALYSILTYAIFKLYQSDNFVDIVIQTVLCAFLIIISRTWLINLRHIQKELKIKYTFMQAMEKFLPVPLFEYEFKSAKEADLKVNSNYEIKFIIAFFCIAILSLILSMILILYKAI